MSETKVPHAVLGNNSARCLNCGEEQAIAFPSSIGVMTAICKAFSKEHAHCKPSDAGRSRFEFRTPQEWIKSWDTGKSSESIWRWMQGMGGDHKSIPHDPADFGRCYRLLKAFPEWRARIREMGNAVPVWRALAYAWDNLEKLYEEELSSGTAPKLWKAMCDIEAAP